MTSENHNQFIVTSWKEGGEHSDETREFSSLSPAMHYAYMRHNDPAYRRVELRSRRFAISPWKVYTISEPDHY